MFDEECQSDQEEDFRMGYKGASKANPKTLTPTEPNMTLSMKQGEELMKLMKERGIEMKDSEIKQMKIKQPETAKKQSKAGFYDGGHSAPLEELMAALKKAYSNNDPQQASCILSYILENKSISAQDRNKFGLMKCNLLFGLASYEDCCDRATTLIEKPLNDIAYAQLSNYLAKCKVELGRVWEGFMDLQRAKALIINYKEQKEKEVQVDRQEARQEEYGDSELDSVIRDITHTEMEYNIRVAKQKSTLNLIFPISNVFRNRRVYQASAGDYHTLFLVGSGEYDKEIKGRWGKQVFGIGQNAAGQVTGNSDHKQMFSEPILIKELSGKGIEGVFGTRQSSLAYDECGNIFEWGAKLNQKKSVELIASLTQKIVKLEKGSKHYCALTQSGRLFVWGRVEYMENPIFNQPKPCEQKIKDVVDFSCGTNYVMAVDKKGDLWALGSNQYGQLAANGEKFFKEFTKINTSRLGPLKKVYCIVQCTFLQTAEQQLFFCGRYSFNKQPIETPKQAQFTDEPKIISVSGQPGLYYITNQNGQAYVWEVDNSVKFKPDRSKDKFSQRFIEYSKINVYRVKTLPVPSLCKAHVVTQQLKTYEPIIVEVNLNDQFGEYGLDLAQPVKYTVHLSRKILKKQQMVEQSQKFLKLTANKYKENQAYVDQIMSSELLTSQVCEQSPSPSTHHLQFSVERSGNYYLYLLMDSVVLNSKPLELNVSTSEKEEQLERKMQEEKERRKQERELQKQREEEQKRLEQEEQQAEAERRKETQKRAEEAYKLHMREQEELRRKQEEDRRRRAQLQTGGGFDLTKLKKKISDEPPEIATNQPITAVTPIFDPKKRRPSQQMQESTQLRRKQLDYENYGGEIPQLPDINARPSSKRKLVLKKPNDPPELKTTATSMIKTGAVRRGSSVKK